MQVRGNMGVLLAFASESENLSVKEIFGQKGEKAKEKELEKEYVMKLGLGYDKNAE